MGMMINRRRAYGGKKLPYDAEIEYLESAGSQVIDLDVNIESISGTEYIRIVSQFSAYNTNLKRNFVQSIGTGNHSHYLEYNTSAIGWWPGGRLERKIDISQNVVYETQFTVYYNKSQISANNQTIETTNYQSGGDLKPIYLFGVYNPVYTDYSKGVRLGKTKLIHNGNIIRDLIPVRVGQVGYLYDKVSGQLFGNSGTGDFVLGPDK